MTQTIKIINNSGEIGIGEMQRIMMLVKTSWWLILLICACASTYPSRPLNERSTELNWQAWLLIDQNNRQTDLGILRRRITPKSVFIAPTFSPDTLPACAEGYRSDSMGRCVKIIRIDEAAHLNFLLQRLNEQFGDYDEESEESDLPTPGPFQFNIPLLGDNENSNSNNDSDYDNETDVAIVVAPTTSSSVKLDVKRNDGDKFNLNNVAAILGVKPEDLETTTISDLTTTGGFSTTTMGTTQATESSTSKTIVPEERTETIDTISTVKTDMTTTEDMPMTTTNLPPPRPTTINNDNNNESSTIIEEDALFFRWKF